MNPNYLQVTYSVLKPLVFRLNPEFTHDIALRAIQNTKPLIQKRYSSLIVDLFGHRFSSPLLLAAGFDKNGLLVDNIQSYGFAGEVVGSVTAKSSTGNPKPRLFRLPKQLALVNRMGLNNDGAEVIAERLAGKSGFAVSIAKTHDPEIQGDEAIDDYLFSYKLVKNLGFCSEINISCPNTIQGKTFENPSDLEVLLNALIADGKGNPLLIKISPGLKQENLQGIVEVADDKVEGYVAINTAAYEDRKIGKGGLSGIPLRQDSNRTIQQLRTLTNKVIIGGNFLVCI